jgi:hypothetical protein
MLFPFLLPYVSVCFVVKIEKEIIVKEIRSVKPSCQRVVRDYK